MKRRDFNKMMVAAVGGLVAGTAFGCKSKDGATSQPVSMHACKALNECKGKGGCKTASNDCRGMNACKGKGGCATSEHHSCKGKNACKGQGGCKTATNDCSGKNACKGKGGCKVPRG